ncbi:MULTISPECIES: SRPBCC domain-containing protein [unclassified Ruegeria]|uniref:SRPBCC family protein n=1 Tax=unclassified Ruegeria TaxID=2625375 RepID=UPI001491096C|nr:MULTISPECIES: SRPBCC domain-containing protein [unclassified Ruegeria]NOD49254.1 SRPBCC domain-containing protein [Ruegeria sp. HKCCD5849]NOD51818.1 SRPBCC domain-containing protein [Ruegeria sp. HKCCD5851]NOD68805.1 SRPBCC domain-containing protein [Ruegeria sp. HKCCD7303]
MADLKLERDFPVSPEDLFAWISDGSRLLQWWGPEGMHVPEHNLDFSRTGPWYSVMENGEGQRYKVSGHVTHVDPPKSVGFTWGWHDDQDQRGNESHVTLSVAATDTGSRLTLDHRELADAEAAANHNQGWTSSLRKLEALCK